MKTFIRFFVILLILICNNLFAGISWEKMNSPLEGKYNTFFVTNDNKMYVNLFGDSIFVSNDLGKSWNLTLFDKKINSQNLFGESKFIKNVNNEIFFSNSQTIFIFNESGQIWNNLDLNLSGKELTCLKNIYYFNDSLYLSIDSNGIYKLSADLKSWSRVITYGPIYPENYKTIAISKNNIFFAQNDNGIFKTSNYGNSWELVDEMSDDRLFSLQDNSIYRQHYDLLKYNNASNRWDTIIFYDSLPFGSSPVLTDNSGNLYQNDYKALLRTTNYGKSWDTLTNKKNICSEEYIVLLTNSADRLYYENWRGIIYTTTDSGKNWDMIDLPFVKHKIESIYPINKDNLLILTDDKLFYSVDGCNNFRLSFAVCTTYTELGKIIKTNNGLYCNYQSSLLHSTDNGSNWVYVIEYFMDYLDFDIDRNGIIYSGYHGISKSSDDGFTWVQINGDLPKSTSYFPYVQALCINNKHELIVSIYDSGFYKSTDDGTTWKLVNKNYNRFGNILSHNNNLYAFTDDYGYYNLDDTNNIIYKSDDYGDSWKEIKFALPNSKFKYYLSPNGYLFASDVGANPQGLYQSIDGGLTWNIFDTNFDSKCIPAVFIEDNGTMWCGTDSGSVYRSKEPVVSVKEQQIFENIILAPNPVNDFLYITGMDNQKIEIFSIEGIKVFESIDPVSKIDVSGFAPGVYFLKARDKVNKFVKM